MILGVSLYSSPSICSSHILPWCTFLLAASSNIHHIHIPRPPSHPSASLNPLYPTRASLVRIETHLGVPPNVDPSLGRVDTVA